MCLLIIAYIGKIFKKNLKKELAKYPHRVYYMHRYP